MILRLLALFFAGASALRVGVPFHRAAAATTSAPAVARRGALSSLSMDGRDKPLKIGVVGVTGAVGKEIIDVLHNRGFNVEELKLYASARSAGKPMATPFGSINIEEFSLESARTMDVVFLAVSGDFALEWANKICENDGPLVIDNSSAFRYDDDVALVVPEINADAARKSKKKLVANPNCTTAIALMALKPLHDTFGIKKSSAVAQAKAPPPTAGGASRTAGANPGSPGGKCWGASLGNKSRRT